MKKKLSIILLSSLLAITPVHADDDVAWAIGGFILGTIVGNNSHDRDRQPERAELPPPRRQPRIVPIYSTVCQWREQYDPWGHPIPPIRTCWQEITGYREVYE